MKKFITVILTISLSFFYIQKLATAKEDSMLSTPEWYKWLAENVEPIEEHKIKSLENLRIKYGFSHLSWFVSILVTPWSVERAQYANLNVAKRKYPKFNDRELWGWVLNFRLQKYEQALMEYSRIQDFDPEPSIRQTVSSRIRGLYELKNLDNITML